MNTILTQWLYSTNLSSFDFYLSLDNGSNWTLLSSNVSGSLPPDPTYNNPIPVIVQTQSASLMKVVDHNNSSNFDTSNSVFTIEYVILQNENIALSYGDGTYTMVTWDTLVASRSQVFYSLNPLTLDSSSIKDVTFQTSHSHILGGLDPYHLYYYKIRSDTDYEIAESTGSFQYIPTPGLAFTAYGAITVDGNLVVLDWATNQYAYSQVIYGSGNVLNLSTPIYSMALVRQLTISNLSLNTNYYFQIIAQRPSGPPPDVGYITSSIISVRTTGDVTIENILTNMANFTTMKTVNETFLMTAPSLLSQNDATTTPTNDTNQILITSQPVQVSTASVFLQSPSAAIMGTEITYSVV